MRIGLFTDTYYPHITGVAVAVEQFYKGLKELGNKVFLIAPEVKGYHDRDSDVIRLPSFKPWPKLPDQVRFPMLIKIQNFVEVTQLDFDLLHGQGAGPFSVLAYLLSKKKKVPFVVTFHTDFAKYTHYFLNGKVLTPKMMDILMNWFLNKSDAIIVPSKKIKLMLEGLKIHKPIFAIPSFVDNSKFKNIDKGFLYKLCKLPENSRIVLSVGRLGKEKSFDFLITSLAPLLAKNNNLHLVIIGPGPEKKNLENLSKSLNINKQVHLPGAVKYENMPKVYADAQVFVFASQTETQGMVLTEAGASSLPLVVVDDPALDQAVDDGVNGFKTRLNHDEFMKKVDSLLEDNELRKKMGKQSCNIMEERFSKEKIMNKILEVYKQLLIKDV